MSSALTVGFKWCEMCIRSDCQCNFQEEECDNCVADDQYNNYRDEAIKAGKLPKPRNKNELNNEGLKILANGPSDDEVMPPNSDIDSLHGNAADRRKRDILIRDIAMKVTAEEEKQDRIEAQTAASILYNSPRIKDAQDKPLSENNDASTKIDEKAQEAKDAAMDENDKELNEKKREEDGKKEGEKKKDQYKMPFDCSIDFVLMDEKTISWCTGRHKNEIPIELDGVTLV